MPGLFLAGQKIQAGRGGIIARGRRTTASTSTTTEGGVLRLDDIPILAGRCYKIWTTPLRLDTVSANVAAAQVRYTTDGSTPSTSSTVLPGSRTDLRQADGAFPENTPIQTTYTPAANETLSLLLSCVATTSAATVIDASATNVIELVVEDMGVDPGDTGTDI